MKLLKALRVETVKSAQPQRRHSTTLSKTQGAPWKGGWKECRSRKMGRRDARRHLLAMTAIVIRSSHLHWTRIGLALSVNNHLWMWEKLMGPYPYLLHCWLLIVSGRVAGGHHRQLNTHWGAHQVPKGNSKPVVIKITLVKFSGPQNKRHEYGKETWETKGRVNRRRRWKG